jgi:hypothetical protein
VVNLATVVIFGAGVILIYAAVKDQSPKQVVSMGLQPQQPAAHKSASTTGHQVTSV